MKKKNRLILLFMLVFAWISMMYYTPALAAAPSGVGIPNCTTAELSAGSCMQIGDYNGTPIWILRAINYDGTPAVETSWLHDDTDNNRTIATYITGVNQDYIDLGQSVSAQSYVVFGLHPVILPTGGDPTGSQSVLNSLFGECDSSGVPDDTILWKLNKVASTKKVARIEIYYPLGTSGVDTTCEKTWILWSNFCGSGRMWTVAGADTLPPRLIEYECTDTNTFVRVSRDECGIITGVTCTTASVTTNANVTYDSYFYAEGADGTTAIIPIYNMSGVVVCSDDGPAYVIGDRTYWCGIPPTAP